MTLVKLPKKDGVLAQKPLKCAIGEKIARQNLQKFRSAVSWKMNI